MGDSTRNQDWTLHAVSALVKRYTIAPDADSDKIYFPCENTHMEDQDHSNMSEEHIDHNPPISATIVHSQPLRAAS